jgi:lysophospholipase L1-like esterase
MVFSGISFVKSAALLAGLLLNGTQEFTQLYYILKSAAILTQSQTVSPTTAQTPDWCASKSGNNSINLKIMPMGASLVYGLESSDGNGFRLGLEKLLENNGSTVTMLGTQSSGSMKQNHHEAYLAITIDKYADKVAKSGAYDMDPNIVLLNLGVNDCWYMADEKHPEDSDPSIDSRTTDGKYTALRFASLLAKIKAGFPKALVLASQLTYNTNEWQDRCIQGVNAHLPAVVANATASGQLIRYVSMYDAVPKDMYQEDGTHPTDEGYQLMAKVWYDAAETALGEVCGGKPATKTGEGEEEGSTATTTGDAAASASPSGSTDQSDEAMASSRPSLTIVSGAGALATGNAMWPVFPLAAWALMG